MIYKQELRSYTSNYNEIVLRTNFETINGEEGVYEFYTDDSMKAIKRKIYDSEEALILNFNIGDDSSMLGLNAYPCNRGLIANDILSETTMGFAYSSPLLCNLFYPRTFEIMLQRSVFNTDLKGLPSARSTDTTLS